MIDDRKYEDLVRELIARIPSHTPEWTNFNDSDPGITLIQLFAHLGESLIYRSNRIPERNRAKFLSLLGVKLNPAQEARGLVTFANERGPIEPLIVGSGTELFAGEVAFSTVQSLDALPLDAHYYVRRTIAEPSQELRDYYALLYASYDRPAPDTLTLYETVEVPGGEEVDLGASVDRSLWIALLGRDIDKNTDNTKEGEDDWDDLRERLAGRTLSLGIVPDQTVDRLVAQPRAGAQAAESLLHFELPNPAVPITFDTAGRSAPAYARLAARGNFDPLAQAGIVELTLPANAKAIDTWRELDPLEAGVGDLPPPIDPPQLAARIVTWLRVRAAGQTDVKLRWVGINAAAVRQRTNITAERLADGDGTPGQERRLRRAPALAGTLTLVSVDADGVHDWLETDDVRTASSEIAIPGVPASAQPARMYEFDPEAGLLRFGYGAWGYRPRPDEALYVSYAATEGVEGNVGAGALKGGPLVPDGVTATNPVPTWGGAEAETLADGERQVARFLTHRDRLVSTEDFEAIAWRTPGLAIGRIDVLPAAHPDVAPIEPGTAPGAVTLMAIPATDAAHPNAPRADRPFLNALCRYLEPRRLVTTELVISGPDYVGIWISVGIEISGNRPAAETIERVKRRIADYFNPLPTAGRTLPLLYDRDADPERLGWPLGRAVNARALLAEAARAEGVLAVEDVLVARGSDPASETVPLAGLELPEILGLSVVIGSPVSLDLVRGSAPLAVTTEPLLPVPIVAETC
ncbi:MAG: hypothetical protein ACJ8ET_09795 [Sphingomicrobium sp.]